MSRVDFQYDVFLSHSAEDKAVVRGVAERLRNDGVKVWLDEWVLKPGDNIPAKIEEGLDCSRVLVLCMSADAFGSDWVQLESGTYRFRDPLNKLRRFIPLRLDAALPKGALAQFLHISWLPSDRESEYPKLLEACRPPEEIEVTREEIAEKAILTGAMIVSACAFTPNGMRAIGVGGSGVVRLWDLETGYDIRVFNGPVASALCVAWSRSQNSALIGYTDRAIRLWDLESGRCSKIFLGHTDAVLDVSWSKDDRFAISAGRDRALRLWNITTGKCFRTFLGHTKSVQTVAWSKDNLRVLSGSEDKTLRLWDVETGSCLRVFEDHVAAVTKVVWSSDDNLALSVGADATLRLWNIETGRCLRVIEGHTDVINTVALSGDDRFAISGSNDGTLRLWSLQTGHCLRILRGHQGRVVSAALSENQAKAFSCNDVGGVRIWNLSEIFQMEATDEKVHGQVQYTNAKVLLVGESGAGKTALSQRLAWDRWEPTDSTVGAWATQWRLPVSTEGGIEREIWLWDFGGQADQRLIHQLYMDETALAILVFDGQKENLFEVLGQWDRDITRASRKEFVKLLVAGRVDAGGLRVSRSELQKFASERGFEGFIETSAKKNIGCDALKEAILTAINWKAIPCRTTELLFKRLKQEIVTLKDDGRVLMRFNELRETLQLRLSGESKKFTDEELRAVLMLLAGPGVVWELAFGSWVLLQPERINAYAQSVIRTLDSDQQQRGCIAEDRVLRGDLIYDSSMDRLGAEMERFVLHAMHQILVERGLCLRQPTATGNLLIFPSYYRRERPDSTEFPSVLVTYRFLGFLDEIYATLVVRLHHCELFHQDKLWRYAADFKTNDGKQLGIKLTRCAPGIGELDVFFDAAVSVDEKIMFSKYVHEHLLQYGREVERLRNYVCPECQTRVGNVDIAMKRLSEWTRVAESGDGVNVAKNRTQPPSIVCVNCEGRVPLWDEMEQCFANPEIRQRVYNMQEETAGVLNKQSKERALVGEIISTVALADQICREWAVSEYGIDMEVEFTDDSHASTNKKLFLLVKNNGSYSYEFRGRDAEKLVLEDDTHVQAWISSPFPVMLVRRDIAGSVVWMEIRESLRQASQGGEKGIKYILFKGERLDVMSVRSWRDKMISEI